MQRALLPPLLLALCLGPGAASAQSAASPAPVATPVAEILPEAEQPAWNAIGRVNIAGYKRRQMCSGTLIAPDLVLTAAHCVLGPRGAPAPPEEIVFVAGWRAGTAAADARGTRLRLHPDYLPGLEVGENRIHADLALLRLAAPLPGITPLPVASLPRGAGLTILGYRHDRPHIASRSAPCAVTALWPGLFETACSVTFGTSGAPVLAETREGWRTVGVVSAGSATRTLVARPDAWVGTR